MVNNLNGFVKLHRGEVIHEILKRPNVLVLLTQIVIRARRSKNDFNPYGLELGEALCGDRKNIGLSASQYKSAKNWLAKNNLVSFKGTNKGTIATLLGTQVFDINIELDDYQDNGEKRTINQDSTTNKKEEDNNKKQEKNWKKCVTPDFENHFEEYYQNAGFMEALRDFIRVRTEEHPNANHTKEAYSRIIDTLTYFDIEGATLLLEDSRNNCWANIYPKDHHLKYLLVEIEDLPEYLQKIIEESY